MTRVRSGKNFWQIAVVFLLFSTLAVGVWGVNNPTLRQLFQNRANEDLTVVAACRKAGGAITGETFTRTPNGNIDSCRDVVCNAACCFDSCICAGTCGAEPTPYIPPPPVNNGIGVQGNPEGPDPLTPAGAGDIAWGKCIQSGGSTESCRRAAEDAYSNVLDKQKHDARGDPGKTALIETQGLYDSAEDQLRILAACKDPFGQKLPDESLCLGYDPATKKVSEVVLPNTKAGLDALVGPIVQAGYTPGDAAAVKKGYQAVQNGTTGNQATQTVPNTIDISAACSGRTTGYGQLMTSNGGPLLCVNCATGSQTDCRNFAAQACQGLIPDDALGPNDPAVKAYNACVTQQTALASQGQPISYRTQLRLVSKSCVNASTQLYKYNDGSEKTFTCSSGSCSLGDCVSGTEYTRRNEQINNLYSYCQTSNMPFEDCYRENSNKIGQGYNLNPDGSVVANVSPEKVKTDFCGGGKGFRSLGSDIYSCSDGKKVDPGIQAELEKQLANAQKYSTDRCNEIIKQGGQSGYVTASAAQSCINLFANPLNSAILTGHSVDPISGVTSINPVIAKVVNPSYDPKMVGKHCDLVDPRGVDACYEAYYQASLEGNKVEPTPTGLRIIDNKGNQLGPQFALNTYGTVTGFVNTVAPRDLDADCLSGGSKAACGNMEQRAKDYCAGLDKQGKAGGSTFRFTDSLGHRQAAYCFSYGGDGVPNDPSKLSNWFSVVEEGDNGNLIKPHIQEFTVFGAPEPVDAGIFGGPAPVPGLGMINNKAAVNYCSAHPNGQGFWYWVRPGVVPGSTDRGQYKFRCHDDKPEEVEDFNQFNAGEVAVCTSEASCPEWRKTVSAPGASGVRIVNTGYYIKDADTIDGISNNTLKTLPGLTTGILGFDQLPDCSTGSPKANSQECSSFRKNFKNFLNSNNIDPASNYGDCSGDRGTGFWSNDQCQLLANWANYETSPIDKFTRVVNDPLKFIVSDHNVGQTTFSKPIDPTVSFIGNGVLFAAPAVAAGSLAGSAAMGPVGIATGAIFVGANVTDYFNQQIKLDQNLSLKGIPCSTSGGGLLDNLSNQYLGTAKKASFNCDSEEKKNRLLAVILADGSKKVGFFAPTGTAGLAYAKLTECVNKSSPSSCLSSTEFSAINEAYSDYYFYGTGAGKYSLEAIAGKDQALVNAATGTVLIVGAEVGLRMPIVRNSLGGVIGKLFEPSVAVEPRPSLAGDLFNGIAKSPVGKLITNVGSVLNPETGGALGAIGRKIRPEVPPTAISGLEIPRGNVPAGAVERANLGFIQPDDLTANPMPKGRTNVPRIGSANELKYGVVDSTNKDLVAAQSFVHDNALVPDYASRFNQAAREGGIIVGRDSKGNIAAVLVNDGKGNLKTIASWNISDANGNAIAFTPKLQSDFQGAAKAQFAKPSFPAPPVAEKPVVEPVKPAAPLEPAAVKPVEPVTPKPAVVPVPPTLPEGDLFSGVKKWWAGLFEKKPAVPEVVVEPVKPVELAKSGSTKPESVVEKPVASIKSPGVKENWSLGDVLTGKQRGIEQDIIGKLNTSATNDEISLALRNAGYVEKDLPSGVRNVRQGLGAKVAVVIRKKASVLAQEIIDDFENNKIAQGAISGKNDPMAARASIKLAVEKRLGELDSWITKRATELAGGDKDLAGQIEGLMRSNRNALVDGQTGRVLVVKAKAADVKQSTSYRVGRGSLSDENMVVNGHGGYIQDKIATSQRAGALADGVTGSGPKSAISADIASKLTNAELERLVGTSLSPEEIAVRMRAFVDKNVQTAVHDGADAAGTTLLAAGVKDGKLIIVEVGDSKIYLIRGNDSLTDMDGLIKWTGFNSQRGFGSTPNQLGATVEEMKAKGYSFGGFYGSKVGIFDLQAGDRILLSSDGLEKMLISGVTDNTEIVNIIKNARSATEADAELLNLARRKLPEVKQFDLRTGQHAADDYAFINIFGDNGLANTIITLKGKPTANSIFSGNARAIPRMTKEASVQCSICALEFKGVDTAKTDFQTAMDAGKRNEARVVADQVWNHLTTSHWGTNTVAREALMADWAVMDFELNPTHARKIFTLAKLEEAANGVGRTSERGIYYLTRASEIQGLEVRQSNILENIVVNGRDWVRRAMDLLPDRVAVSGIRQVSPELGNVVESVVDSGRTLPIPTYRTIGELKPGEVAPVDVKYVSEIRINSKGTKLAKLIGEEVNNPGVQVERVLQLDDRIPQRFTSARSTSGDGFVSVNDALAKGDIVIAKSGGVGDLYGNHIAIYNRERGLVGDFKIEGMSLEIPAKPAGWTDRVSKWWEENNPFKSKESLTPAVSETVSEPGKNFFQRTWDNLTSAFKPKEPFGIALKDFGTEGEFEKLTAALQKTQADYEAALAAAKNDFSDPNVVRTQISKMNAETQMDNFQARYRAAVSDAINSGNPINEAVFTGNILKDLKQTAQEKGLIINGPVKPQKFSESVEQFNSGKYAKATVEVDEARSQLAAYEKFSGSSSEAVTERRLALSDALARQTVAEDEYKAAVREAISEGRPIDPGIFRKYPELQPKQPSLIDRIRKLILPSEENKGVTIPKSAVEPTVDSEGFRRFVGAQEKILQGEDGLVGTQIVSGLELRESATSNKLPVKLTAGDVVETEIGKFVVGENNGLDLHLTASTKKINVTRDGVVMLNSDGKRIRIRLPADNPIESTIIEPVVFKKTFEEAFPKEWAEYQRMRVALDDCLKNCRDSSVLAERRLALQDAENQLNLAREKYRQDVLAAVRRGERVNPKVFAEFPDVKAEIERVRGLAEADLVPGSRVRGIDQDGKPVIVALQKGDRVKVQLTDGTVRTGVIGDKAPPKVQESDGIITIVRNPGGVGERTFVINPDFGLSVDSPVEIKVTGRPSGIKETPISAQTEAGQQGGLFDPRALIGPSIPVGQAIVGGGILAIPIACFMEGPLRIVLPNTYFFWCHQSLPQISLPSITIPYFGWHWNWGNSGGNLPPPPQKTTTPLTGGLPPDERGKGVIGVPKDNLPKAKNPGGVSVPQSVPPMIKNCPAANLPELGFATDLEVAAKLARTNYSSWQLAAAVMRQESGCNPKTGVTGDSVGLMQIVTDTGKADLVQMFKELFSYDEKLARTTFDRVIGGGDLQYTEFKKSVLAGGTGVGKFLDLKNPAQNMLLGIYHLSLASRYVDYYQVTQGISPRLHAQLTMVYYNKGPFGVYALNEYVKNNPNVPKSAITWADIEPYLSAVSAGKQATSGTYTITISNREVETMKRYVNLVGGYWDGYSASNP